jgi:hypothetical protein
MVSALGAPFDRLSADGFASLYLEAVWGEQPGSAAGEAQPQLIEHQSRVPGGNQRICVELAQRLTVRLESPVAHVSQDAHGA